MNVDFLIVAGGGAGGGSDHGAGGGAGGLVFISGHPVTDGTPYTITVGAGGSGVAGNRGGNGTNSSAFTFVGIGGGGVHLQWVPIWFRWRASETIIPKWRFNRALKVLQTRESQVIVKQLIMV